MKAIFLDIDGVLNSEASVIYHFRVLGKLAPRDFEREQRALCPICISNLNYLFEMANDQDLKIVISSTWRLTVNLDEIKKTIEVQGFLFPEKIIDATPIWRKSDFYPGRCDEIEAWLNQHPEVTEYSILDDSADLGRLIDKAVITDAETGLTLKNAKETLEKLKRK